MPPALNLTMTLADEARLKRHARKFRECSVPGQVLQRYASKSEVMRRPDLLRHIAHVSAWVALAEPLDDASEPRGPGGLSPVRVLTEMLVRLGRKKLDSRVRMALEAVTSSCRMALQSQSRLRKEDWLHLRAALPMRREKPSAKPVQRNCDLGGSDELTFKRVRRVNRSVCQWRGRDVSAGLAVVSGVRERLAACLQSAKVDTAQLRKLLYQVIGALAPPRSKPRPRDEPLPLDVAAADRLEKTAKLQRAVRQILITGLHKWRNQFYLEDSQVAPVLAHVRRFIECFEQTHGAMQHACAGKQWQRLEEVVALDPAGDGCAGCAGDSGSKLIRTPTKSNGIRPVVAWEWSVATTLFREYYATDVKSGGKRIYVAR